MAAPEPKKDGMPVPHNPATLRQFVAILIQREAQGEINKDQLRAELVKVGQVAKEWNRAQ